MLVRTLKTATLLALAVCSTLALADDPPALVGRVALTQGQVSVKSDGEAANAALVNWPVTSHQTISTAPGARTELRVGSTAIRLDGDSALEVVELDDDRLRLRLHYGSASIRVVNADLAAGFELTTPQARVLLQGPGRVRVDAERMQDTSGIRVFDGVATVEGGGERLTLRSGRSAEVQGNDLRMSQALSDAFDDWARMRDRESETVRTTRYVPAEMTGIEDLDRHGTWRDDSEYGALWLPAVAANWVPYRDGRWTWIAPWGWTWVDNAPWGYAPFHYGRWVHVNNRWAWAPGRLDSRPVWAPALVGWVGGAGWGLNVDTRPSLAQGWYPLSPYDRFVPGYRHSDQHLRRLNADDGRHDGKRDGRRDGHRDGHDYRQRGLTVVPQDRFGQRGEVVVRHESRVTPPANWQQAPLTQPPMPRGWRERGGIDGGRRGDRPATPTVTTAPPVPPVGFVRQPGVITTLPAPEVQREWRRDGRDGRDGREAFEDGRRQRGDAAGVSGAPTTVPPAQPFTPRGGTAGAMEAALMRAQAQAQGQAQMQMQRQAPAALAPPPRAMPSPPPAPVAAPQAAPQAAPREAPIGREAPVQRGEGRRERDGVRQLER